MERMACAVQQSFTFPEHNPQAAANVYSCMDPPTVSRKVRQNIGKRGKQARPKDGGSHGSTLACRLLIGRVGEPDEPIVFWVRRERSPSRMVSGACLYRGVKRVKSASCWWIDLSPAGNGRGVPSLPSTLPAVETKRRGWARASSIRPRGC
ncbi:hypothetical protein MUK42_13821 [Musa troglodytarum]|uniref:Uncharacterized protein n=1 Tax=Musa troglodytarum TaxID=320322 RepID=A0A9E7IH49_9LILI|nr:hypothetical protein MUK42_13821 [Musa troglodytarum]